MVKGILSFVSPRCLCDRTISLTDETAQKYTENGSELSESIKMFIGKVVGTFRTLHPDVYPQGKRSEKKAFGKGRQLYRIAITSPYAPAERNAIRSLRCTSFNSTSLPNTSDDSQTGPTTS